MNIYLAEMDRDLAHAKEIANNIINFEQQYSEEETDEITKEYGSMAAFFCGDGIYMTVTSDDHIPREHRLERKEDPRWISIMVGYGPDIWVEFQPGGRFTVEVNGSSTSPYCEFADEIWDWLLDHYWSTI